MRRSILAFVMVAIVVAEAPPAGAIDNGFAGRYRVIGAELGDCPGADRDRVQVGYVNERVRYLAHAGLVWSGRLGYLDGERFPWQTTKDGPRRFELRYDAATDTAVGSKYGLEDRTCRVRLIPLD
jgi:hypothetical protein